MPPTGLLQPRSRSRVTLPACTAVILICGVVSGLWFVLHYIQTYLAKQPLLVLLFPPLAMSTLALVIPLLMFISYQDDFRHLNPAHPLHFITISKRCYSALSRNNMKVTEKDL